MRYTTTLSREALGTSQALSSGNDGSAGVKYGERISWVSRPDAALTISAYYRAVDIISSSIALMPIEYMIRKSYTSPFIVASNPRGRNLNYLLNVRPNGRMNAYQMKKQAIVQVMNKGNAYIYPVRGIDGEVQALYLLSEGATINDYPSHQMVSFIDNLNGIAKNNVPYTDIIILRNSYLDREGKGISTISFAKQSLTTASTYASENIKRVANGGRIKGIIKNANTGARGTYTNGQLKKQRNELQDQVDEGNDILVLSGDSTFQPNQMSYADLQWMEQGGATIEDISRFTGCPLALLMRNSNSNYKTLQDSNNEFLVRALAPRISDWECEMSSTLILPGYADVQTLKFNTRPLFALDLSAMASWNKSRIETGLACPNELRMENNLAPIEGGDKHYVLSTLAVVGSDKLMSYGGGRPSEDNGDDDKNKGKEDE